MSLIFTTGGAGFIGSSTEEKLLTLGYDVITIDNLDSYYDIKLKEANLKKVQDKADKLGRKFTFLRGDIRDKDLITKIYQENDIDATIAWAALAGVRPSITDPLSYVDVNIGGLMNILEALRNSAKRKLVFISSSSVYGNNKNIPFKESDIVDRPISPYAATKKSGELLCHTYHHLFDIDVHCLRYFTVYGPRQRPDLAINKFTRLMLEGEKIPMFGDGETARDYTYIDDIVDGTIRSMEYLLSHNKVYDIFNLGSDHPIKLIEMIQTIAEVLKVEPKIERLPMQAGDVDLTYSDISHAKEVLGYDPKTSFKEGIERFVAWYKQDE